MKNICKVGIIGGGCAGCTAALYAARADLKPFVFCGNLDEKGGLLTKTSLVENFPGFPEGIKGFDLIENMQKQAEKNGASLIDETVKQVDFSTYPYVVRTEEKKTFECLSIIIATGATPKKLGLPKEDQFWGKGISTCSVCDGALYRNKAIIVVGGGDGAMEHALFLTKFSSVTLLHRGSSFGRLRRCKKRS